MVFISNDIPNHELDDTELLFQHKDFYSPVLGADISLVARNLRATAIISSLIKDQPVTGISEHHYLILETVLDILKADHINYFIISKTDLFRDLTLSIGSLPGPLRVFYYLLIDRAMFSIF